jgi:hypothetical protein
MWNVRRKRGLGTIGTVRTMVPTAGGSRERRDHPDQYWTIISMSRATPEKNEDRRPVGGWRIFRAPISRDRGPDRSLWSRSTVGSLCLESNRRRRVSRRSPDDAGAQVPVSRDHAGRWSRPRADASRLRDPLGVPAPGRKRARPSGIGSACKKALLHRTKPTPGSTSFGSVRRSLQPTVACAARYSNRWYVASPRRRGPFRGYSRGSRRASRAPLDHPFRPSRARRRASVATGIIVCLASACFRFAFV